MNNRFGRIFYGSNGRRNILIVIAFVIAIMLLISGSVVSFFGYRLMYVSEDVMKKTIGEEVIVVGGNSIKIGAENIKDIDINNKKRETIMGVTTCIVDGEIEIENKILKLDAPFEAEYIYREENERIKAGWELKRFYIYE